MTYRDALQWSVDCQDACNLSGVVHSFDNAIHAIFEESQKRGEGTDWINQHPAVTLYLDKLSSLNRSQCLCSFSTDLFSIAYRKVQEELEALKEAAND